MVELKNELSYKRQCYAKAKIHKIMENRNMKKFWTDTFDPQLTYYVKTALERL